MSGVASWKSWLVMTAAATVLVAGLSADDTSPSSRQSQPAEKAEESPNRKQRQGEKAERERGRKAASDSQAAEKQNAEKREAEKKEADRASAEKQAAAEKQEKRRDQESAEEQAALAFAKENHPELASLLEQLRSSSPKGYQSAIAELTRDRERLARVQERTPDRYESELALWRLDSRIRLLAARSAMSDGSTVRAELKELLAERREVKLARLKSDLERQQVRMERLESSIAELESGGDEAVENELEQLLGRAQRRADEVRPRGAATTSVKERGGRDVETKEVEKK